MSISMGGLDRRLSQVESEIKGVKKKNAVLEAKLESYKQRLSAEHGVPDEEEIMRRIKSKYPDVDAATIDEISPSNL